MKTLRPNQDLGRHGDGSELLQPWKDWSARAPASAPRDVNPSGTKHWAFGFRGEPGKLQSCTNSRAAPGSKFIQNWHSRVRAVAPVGQIIMRRGLGPREGDERLSAKKQSESDETHGKRAKKPSPEKSGRKQRSTDLGRALRSIYDDTLRESVPDDFLNLIGKLS